MAIIKCPECGKEISTDAASCPNCGKPISVQKKKQGCGKTLLYSVAGLIFLFVVMSIVSGDSKTATTSSQERPIVVEVEQICGDYDQNEVAADQKYKNKLVQISGYIDDVAKDVTDNMYVTFKRAKQFEVRRPQFFFSKKYESDLASLRKGQSVTIVGRCAGLFMNVLIKDAHLQK